MEATRREFLRGSLGVALTSKLQSTAFWHAGSAHENAYGSSNFGAWIEDEFGLPAFQYTCNQTTDPRAVTQVQPGVLTPTEHVHQVGNDRITALASNYGHVRVRQDEGCPKFLNDVDPETHQFAGGLGYLTDGEETLTTYYDGSNAGFERIFGVGYYRKKVRGRKYSIDQIISAPFGDDPVLLSQATLTNHTDATISVRWLEYWGCQPYQFSFRAAIESMTGIGNQTKLRRDLGRRFSHRVVQVEGSKGLLESKHFDGRSPQEETAWERAKASLRANPSGFTAPVADLRPGTDFESLDLPQTFLVSLDGPVSGFSSDAAAFFGAGGPANPSGLRPPLDGKLDPGAKHTGLLLERTLHLAPQQSRTIRFLYGYLPTGFTLDALIKKYEKAGSSALSESSQTWKQKGMRFTHGSAVTS